jgi:hypothetical protein
MNALASMLFEVVDNYKMNKAKRMSGLQIQVLSMYRIMLRAAETKTNSSQIKNMIRSEFKKNGREIPTAQTNRIEWHLNQSRSKLELLQNPNMTNITVFGPDS